MCVCVCVCALLLLCVDFLATDCLARLWRDDVGLPGLTTGLARLGIRRRRRRRRRCRLRLHRRLRRT